MYSYLATASESRYGSTVKPPSKLVAALFVFNLLIILQVVTYDKARAHATPLAATKFLLRTSGNDTELLAIFELHHDFSFRGSLELFDFEVLDELFVFRQLPGYITQVFNRKLLIC